MSERPNLILAALLATATLVAAMVLTALVVSGECRVSGIASFFAASLTACRLFVQHMHRVTVAWLVLAALAGLSLVAFMRSLVIWARARRLLGLLPVELVSEGLLAEIAAMGGARLYIASSRRPAAFCDGLLRRRIVITSALLEGLSADEQEAVVWHESHHAAEREPLKVLVAALATRTFFWLPSLADLFERYLLAKELVADRLAVRKTGVHALAGALSTAAPIPLGAVGVADCISPRVERLVNPQAKLPPLFRRRRLFWTVTGVVGLLVLFALPVTVDVDPAHLHGFLSTAWG